MTLCSYGATLPVPISHPPTKRFTKSAIKTGSGRVGVRMIPGESPASTPCLPFNSLGAETLHIILFRTIFQARRCIPSPHHRHCALREKPPSSLFFSSYNSPPRHHFEDSTTIRYNLQCHDDRAAHSCVGFSGDRLSLSYSAPCPAVLPDRPLLDESQQALRVYCDPVIFA